MTVQTTIEKEFDQFHLKFFRDATLTDILINILKSLKSLGRLGFSTFQQLEQTARKIVRGLNKTPDDWELMNSDNPDHLLTALENFLNNSAWESGKVTKYPNDSTLRVTLRLRRV